MESVERWRSNSPTGSQRRKLSFHPIDEWHPPAAQADPVGAFQVSKGKRIAQVTIAVLYNLLAAGIVFGFAAIKPVFISEGVYRDRCTKQELDNQVWVCYEQELRLNFMFTIAAVSTNVCALPVGATLDRFGPRITSIIGVVLLSAGALFLAFAADLSPHMDAYILGYLFLALGGPFVFISSFQLSNTFPKHSGLVLALLTGAFDTSSALFLVYRLIYQGTDRSFKPKQFFLIYLVVPALILVAQILVMPASSYKTVGELAKVVEEPATAAHASNEDFEDENEREIVISNRRAVDEITNLLGNKNGQEQANAEQKKQAQSGVWGALHGRTALQQIMSPWFILITLFTVIQMTRINYFVATIRTQYTELLHSYPQAVKINEVFDIALPLGGVLAVPLIGLVLDHTSVPFVLGLLVTFATAIGVLGVIPATWAAYANVALFVVYRPLYYTAVSDYAAKVFGFQTFGTVYGLIICLAGLGNFSQAGLDALTHKTFHNDPVPVNSILLVVAFVVGVALVGFVFYRARSMERNQLDEEAEGAGETLMPDAEPSQVNRPHGHQEYGTA
ncbi:hypothetical protein MBLNU457_3121t1 [Dothideomycetes sp. NU457]